jgi:hypothetical protein
VKYFPQTLKDDPWTVLSRRSKANDRLILSLEKRKDEDPINVFSLLFPQSIVNGLPMNEDGVSTLDWRNALIK